MSMRTHRFIIIGLDATLLASETDVRESWKVMEEAILATVESQM